MFLNFEDFEPPDSYRKYSTFSRDDMNSA